MVNVERQAVLPSRTALLIGKFPPIPTIQPEESAILPQLEEVQGEEPGKGQSPNFWTIRSSLKASTSLVASRRSHQGHTPHEYDILGIKSSQLMIVQR